MTHFALWLSWQIDQILNTTQKTFYRMKSYYWCLPKDTALSSSVAVNRGTCTAGTIGTPLIITVVVEDVVDTAAWLPASTAQQESMLLNTQVNWPNCWKWKRTSDLNECTIHDLNIFFYFLGCVLTQ